MNYYNELDKFAAQWLRELIKAGQIAPGIVDDRSIKDVMPGDLKGFTQCHFFAGIGGWSLALRTAGWADDRAVWTGSCPCQPFSSAGKKKGVNDDRHLWPAFYELIKKCKPPVVFGEQVAQKAGAAWFDLVQADMEAENYTCGMVVFPACSVGAPHQRQRLYWVADTESERGGKRHAHTSWSDCRGGEEQGAEHLGSSATDGMANATGDDQRRAWQSQSCGTGTARGCGATGSTTYPTNGYWRAADWLRCTDGKFRAVESSFKQMVDGVAIGLVYLRDECTEEERRNIDEAANNPNAREVLQAMWEPNAPEVVWLSIGRQIGFHAASVLFSSVLKLSGKLGDITNRTAQGISEVCESVLREMWEGKESSRPPQRQELPQQLREQFENAMRGLPQTGTLTFLRSLNGSPLADGLPARVGRLRGYGNAIVIPQAQAFIESYMECLND